MRWREAPWAAGAVGAGALAVQAPLVASGLGATAAMTFLPWMALFGLLAAAANVQSGGYDVAGVTVRPDMLVVLAFSIRAFSLSDRRPLDGVAWTLIAFIGLQAATSMLHAADVGQSMRSAGLLAIGVLAYCATVAAISTRDRLVTATRWFCWAAGASAAVGIWALAWHWATGSGWGIVRLETLAGFPAVMGVAFEHGVYGSVCAALAIAAMALWREDNPVLTRAQAAMLFWLGTGGTLLSLSRGAWVAYVLGIAAVWLVRVGRSTAGLLVWGALALAAAGVGAGFLAGASTTGAGSETAAAVQTQAGQVLAFGGSTGAARLQEWQTSLSETARSPLLGLGTNSYGQRHFDRTQYGPKPAYVGNWAVRTVYDSGLIGLLLLAGALGAAVWPGPRVRRAEGELAPIARALALGGLVLLVAYLATDALLLVWPWIWFGLARSARLLATEQGDGRA